LGTLDFEEEFTLEAWIYLEYKDTKVRILFEHENDFFATHQGYDDSGKKFELKIENCGGSQIIAQAGIEEKVFYHFAFSNSVSEGKSFLTLNGVEVEGINLSAAGLTEFLIGRRSTGDDSDENANMSIREVRIWKEFRIRGALEQTLYNYVDPSQEPVLHRYWKMDEDTGTVIHETVLNQDFDISFQKAPKWKDIEDVPQKCNADQYYDSQTSSCLTISGILVLNLTSNTNFILLIKM
jgi:hypothetical protein